MDVRQFGHGGRLPQVTGGLNDNFHMRGILSLLLGVLLAGHADAAIDNLTGLPAYPNLTSGTMDRVFHTEALGRWCARFTGTSSDSLTTVETWYRKTLLRASETDLANDGQYRALRTLSGIKLALGVDYVAVYRIDAQQTYIELHRCEWNR
jgi:hypothetical protein